MQNVRGDMQDDAAQTPNDVGSLKRACPACGSDGHRCNARFCMTCGGKLEDLEYLPAASLLASYHMQRPSTVRRQTSDTSMRRPYFTKVTSPNRNGASSIAIAFVTYALVPYLGILFCPGAVLMGGVGLVRQWRLPHLGGRSASYVGVVFGIVIFSAQVFLWWILYRVPQWATGVEF